MSDTLVTPNPVAAAQSCLLESAEPIAVLRIHEFADDSEAHDDVLQGSLRQAFEAAFSEAVASLEAAFGPSVELLDGPDTECIPLCGVFCAAAWEVNGQRLFLAAAHEDRETPLLLVVGVAD
jgi:hypothetical protein